jgi:hypothetical protein
MLRNNKRKSFVRLSAWKQYKKFNLNFFFENRGYNIRQPVIETIKIVLWSACLFVNFLNLWFFLGFSYYCCEIVRVAGNLEILKVLLEKVLLVASKPSYPYIKLHFKNKHQ